MLVNQVGAKKMAFADPLKDAAKIIFSWTDEHVYGALKEVVDPYWGFTPRWALQKLGTEGVRDVIGKDTWVKSTRRRIEACLAEGQHVILTDVRFPEEARLVKELGGAVWLIQRDSLPELAADAHPSETAMVFWDFDRVIKNNGTLGELALQVYETWDGVR